MADKSRIKILRIIARLNVGGPAMHTAILTGELNDAEYESRLICGAVGEREGDMNYILEPYNIKPTYISRFKRDINLFNDIVTFCALFKCMRQYRPHIVHTHTAKAGALGRIAALLAKVPVRVHTFHGHVFSGYFSKSSTKLFIFLERILAKFTDSIIAISQLQKDEIVSTYRITGPEKCRIIKLGLELDKFLNSERKRGGFRKRHNLGENDILVGTIGRLTAIKNHRMFIESIAYLEKRNTGDAIGKTKFLIVGDGELKDDLLRYAVDLGIDKRIIFTGWFKDMDELYADLDIVVLTSQNEGTPVSLIEAMASSKAVISTDVGGVRDTVGSIGVLVNKGDHEMLGEKILELASSSERRRELGRLGRELVGDIYSKDRLTSELKDHYRNLLASKRSGG